MKCKVCQKEITSEEIAGTLGMRTGYCCDEIQIDIDSLRINVKQAIISRENDFIKLLSQHLADIFVVK